MRTVELVYIWQKIKSIVITLFALAVFYLVLLFAFPGWSEGGIGKVSILLKPRVVVDGPWIRLGDVADLSDEAFSSLVLMPAPEVGDMIRIDSEDLRQILARRGIFAEVRGRVLVSRGQNLLKGTMLRKKIVSILRRDGYELEQKVLPDVVAEGEVTVDYPPACGGYCYARVRVGDRSFLVRIRPRVEGKAWRLKVSLLPGEVIKPEDVELVECADVNSDMFPFYSSPVGWTVKHPLREGDFLLRKDVLRRYLIRRGEKVQVVYRGNGISLKAVGIALENGMPDDVLRVRNVDSGKVILARVIGPGVVEVEI